MNKEGKLGPIVIALGVSMLIAFFWSSLDFIRTPTHKILDPTAGALIQWQLTLGMLIVVAVLTFITVIIQKYTTDQKTLKELKKEQKEINKRAQALKHDPQKMLEVQKEMMPLTGKIFKLSLRSMSYTAIPLILFFRWFNDFFSGMGSPKFFGFMGWLIFYLVASVILNAIFRKVLDVA